MNVSFIKKYTIVVVIIEAHQDFKTLETTTKKYKEEYKSTDIDYARKNISLKYIPKTEGGPTVGKQSFYYYIKGYKLIPKT